MHARIILAIFLSLASANVITLSRTTTGLSSLATPVTKRQSFETTGGDAAPAVSVTSPAPAETEAATTVAPAGAAAVTSPPSSAGGIDGVLTYGGKAYSQITYYSCVTYPGGDSVCGWHEPVMVVSNSNDAAGGVKREGTALVALGVVVGAIGILMGL